MVRFLKKTLNSSERAISLFGPREGFLALFFGCCIFRRLVPHTHHRSSLTFYLFQWNFYKEPPGRIVLLSFQCLPPQNLSFCSNRCSRVPEFQCSDSQFEFL